MTSKARDKSQDVEWHYTLFTGDGSISHEQDITTPRLLLAESIDSGSGRGQFNACKHVQIRRDLTPQSFSYIHEGGELSGKKLESYDNYPGEYDEWGLIVPFEYPVGFVGRSFQAMQPRLASDLSIPNFLIELKDLKGMMESLVKNFGFLTPSTRRLMRNQGIKRGKKLSNSQVASDAHLQYAFGIAPLMSDIAALQNAVINYINDYNKFVDAMGTVQVRHFRETVNIPSEEKVMGVGNFSLHSSYASSVRVQYCATMKYIYYPSGDRNRKLSAKDYMLPYYGFRTGNALSIAWNAMPFSFVVDWVLKVGDLLDSQSGSALGVDVAVLDYCISQHWERSYEFRIEDRPDVPHMRMEPASFMVSKTRCEFYQRTPLAPNVAATSWVLPRVDGLSIRELLLGSSLLNMRR